MFFLKEGFQRQPAEQGSLVAEFLLIKAKSVTGLLHKTLTQGLRIFPLHCAYIILKHHHRSDEHDNDQEDDPGQLQQYAALNLSDYLIHIATSTVEEESLCFPFVFIDSPYYNLHAPKNKGGAGGANDLWGQMAPLPPRPDQTTSEVKWPRKVPDTDEKAGKNTHWSRWLQRVYTPIVRSLKSVQIQACQPFFNSNLNGHKAQCCVK